MPNNSSIVARNTGGAGEIAFIGRAGGSNSTTVQYGAGGFNIRNQSAVSALRVDNATFNIEIGQGSVQILTATAGFQQKAVAVAGGTANGALNTGVVLVAGTVTINNSYVTTACVGFASISTTGGTPGAYSIVCGSGNYTVTSTSNTDTSTLNVFFIKGF